jgi:hypothetical protein
VIVGVAAIIRWWTMGNGDVASIWIHGSCVAHTGSKALEGHRRGRAGVSVLALRWEI